MPSYEDGMGALFQHWEAQRRQHVAAAQMSMMAHEGLHIIDIPTAELTATGQELTIILPEMLIGAELVEKGPKTEYGDIVIAVTPIFRRFLRELERDPNALYHLDPRQAEELVAGGYEGEPGVEKIELTPRSGDKGRDVIVTSSVFGTIRILDQVKLFSPGRAVEANDVRALFGVVALDHGATKGIVTTSSTFAPGVYEEFAQVIPNRLTLRDGKQLREWLFRKP